MKHAAMIALLLVVAVGCGQKDTPSAPGKKGARQPAFPVEVLRIEAKPHDVVVTAPGMIDAFERIQVTARVSGVVDKVTFAEGQEVKRGQVLAYVDSRRFALNVSSARAALAKAEATAAEGEQSLLRRQNASATNPGLIPGEELETYQTRLNTAKADADQAREALKLAQLNLDDSRLKAQAEGIIQTRTVETGQYVQAGTVIATLLQREPMLLRFSVSTAEAPRVKVGMDAAFTLKESQQRYTAKITLVAAAADADSRLVAVTAEVQADHKFWLRPGSFAVVEVKIPSTRLMPMIPQASARPSDRGFLAYVVEGDVAHERKLQLGLNTADGWVEVQAGLSAGESLVTRGVEALIEGAKVQVVPASPTASSSGHAGTAGSSAASADSSGARRRGPPAGASANPASTAAP